uniref:Autophagy-related protein 3 n=1 Tax=Parastrongyloides trichosuri TaxID=131310 RepID=A0A0N4Z0Q1_PARTI
MRLLSFLLIFQILIVKRLKFEIVVHDKHYDTDGESFKKIKVRNIKEKEYKLNVYLNAAFVLCPRGYNSKNNIESKEDINNLSNKSWNFIYSENLEDDKIYLEDKCYRRNESMNTYDTYKVKIITSKEKKKINEVYEIPPNGKLPKCDKNTLLYVLKNKPNDYIILNNSQIIDSKYGGKILYVFGAEPMNELYWIPCKIFELRKDHHKINGLQKLSENSSPKELVEKLQHFSGTLLRNNSIAALHLIGIVAIIFILMMIYVLLFIDNQKMNGSTKIV